MQSRAFNYTSISIKFKLMFDMDILWYLNNLNSAQNVLFLMFVLFFSFSIFPPFPLMNQIVMEMRRGASRSAFQVRAYASLSANLLKLSQNTKWYLKSLSETICIGTVRKC